MLFEQGDDIGRSELQTGVELVGQQVLHPLMLLHVGQKDQALDLRLRVEAGFGRPPVRAQVPDSLCRLRQCDAIRPGDHRPTAGQIVIGKAQGILPLPDVFGDDWHSVAVVVGEITEQKARVGRFEDDLRRQAVERHGLLDPGFHVG